MLVCGDQSSYLFNLEQKTAIPLEYPFVFGALVPDPRSKCSFIASTPSNNIVYYNDGVRSQFQVR